MSDAMHTGCEDCCAAEIARLREDLGKWQAASQCGHPDPCTLGPLCPYCEIANLRAKLEAAEAKAERLESAMLGDPKVLELRVDENGAEGSVEHPAARMLAESFLKTVGDAANYVETKWRTGDGREVVVTIARSAEQTPHALLTAARRDTARLDALERQLGPSRQWIDENMLGSTAEGGR